NLLEQLQGEFGLSYIFIVYDFLVVRYLADCVAVMYLGKIVEIGIEDEIYERLTHLYTQVLLSAVFVPDLMVRDKKVMIWFEGDVSSLVNLLFGCRFCMRCWKA